LNKLLQRRLALLDTPAHRSLLAAGLRGIEREALRVTRDGQLSQTAHPKALGSALCHGQITTDYSEALLEFITPALSGTDCLQDLERIHRFAASRLQGEWLWSASMPCRLPDEADIPIAYYGHSNIGKLKAIYRKGLALRYGKTMQCIAGIHYNFSLDERLFDLLQKEEGINGDLQDYQSHSYIALIRNFRRYSWLLMYLFGASPALDSSFMRSGQGALEKLDDKTFYLPFATSLRMSDLGYQSAAQRSLTPCYNDLASYTDSLRRAVSTPWPPYVAQGTHDKNGNWQQLSCNILQIENEYYSSIRPKRVTQSGERPLAALLSRGVQYIEVRCLDINPFLPLGIDQSEARFLEVFLLYCALQQSPLLEDGECQAATDNFLQTVSRGREPGLMLNQRGQSVLLRDWGKQILQDCIPIAELLSAEHSRALIAQQEKFDNPEQTPSAGVLNQLQQNQISFVEFALKQSDKHAAYLAKQPLTAEQQLYFELEAKQSLDAQNKLEAASPISFDSFVADWLSGGG